MLLSLARASWRNAARNLFASKFQQTLTPRLRNYSDKKSSDDCDDKKGKKDKESECEEEEKSKDDVCEEEKIPMSEICGKPEPVCAEAAKPPPPPPIQPICAAPPKSSTPACPELKPTPIVCGKGGKDGAEPDYSTPVNVSPLIKLFRWSFLIAGIIFGIVKQREYEKEEAEFQKLEAKRKKIRDKELAELKRRRTIAEKKALELLSLPITLDDNQSAEEKQCN